jgi:hypothetical protein
MHHKLFSLAVAGLLIAAFTPAMKAQEHDWPRAHRLIEKVQTDLRAVEHHDTWPEADRGHYDAAERNLTDVRHDLDENRLDRGKLDAAIGEMEHISHVNLLDPKVRETVNEDVRELRRLRDEWHWER